MTEENKVDLYEQERNAIDLIARTPEGKLLHRYLRRVLEAVFDIESESTLRVSQGRRTLARDLMRLMAEGIEATSDRSDGNADKPILTGGRKPIDTSGGQRRGVARRVSIEPGDGWLPEPDGPS